MSLFYQDPNRFTAYKRSVQNMHQWGAVSGLTFEESHTFTNGEVADKDGYFFDLVNGKYRWVVCATEYYRGDGK
jgi:hypothetical protein